MTGVAGSGTTLTSSLLDQKFQNRLCMHESAAQDAEKSSPLYSARIESFASLEAYYRAIHFPPDLGDHDVRRALLRLYRQQSWYREPMESDVVIDKAANVHLVRIGQLRPAFRDARVLAVFRDPAVNVEGLRRKWRKVFGGASVAEVCDFWEATYREFIEAVRPFEGDVFWLEYESLVRDPEGKLEALGRFFNLEPRTEPRRYKDKPNVPGRGLRNVEGGQIRIVPEAVAASDERQSAEERALVHDRLKGIYQELKDRAGRPA